MRGGSSQWREGAQQPGLGRGDAERFHQAALRAVQPPAQPEQLVGEPPGDLVGDGCQVRQRRYGLPWPQQYQDLAHCEYR